MKKLSVILAFVLMFSLVMGCTVGLAEEVYNMTFAHSTAEVTSMHHGAVKFKEYVEANSDNRIKVNIYPNAQLGGDREIIEGTQAGSVTLMESSSAPQVNFVPSAVIFDLPFVYANKEEARKTLTDPVFVEAISEAYAKTGFKYLGASDQGFRTLTANKVIKSPSDMEGLTLRTMENKYHLALWKQVGANPTPLAFNELYTALQQGTVDAQENPIELIYSQKFYEQQDYIILTNHMYQTIVWIMNLDFYNSLPDDLKLVVDDAAAQAIKDANIFQDKNVAEWAKEMEEYGVEFITLDEEQRSKFAEKATNVYDMIKENCYPKVFEAYMNALGK